MSEENVELLRRATETFNRGHLEAGRRTGGMEKPRLREVLAFPNPLFVCTLSREPRPGVGEALRGRLDIYRRPTYSPRGCFRMEAEL